MDEYVIRLVGNKTVKVRADENYLDNNFVTFVSDKEVVMRVNASKIIYVKRVDR